jgi:AraC-like DNA-binding protein
VLELIRASGLQGFPELVVKLGGDPALLLAEAGIEPAVVGDLEAYIPYQAVAGVIERAATVLASPDFGLRLSTHQGLEIVGPVALIARHATTVGDGLQGLAKYLHVYSPAIGVTIDPLREGEARYTFSILASGLPARAQAEELSLGVALQAFRLLIGQHFRPLRVAVPHAPLSEPARYREFFDADVQFEQDRCGFDLRSDYLTRPVARDDALVRDLATRYLESPAAGSTDSPAAALKALIARTLPTGQCTITAIARDLALHPRTLQRRLAREGTTFEELLDTVRRDQARRYLQETTIPMSQLSALLGYSEQSSLSRACRTWFGAPPRAVRTQGTATSSSSTPRPRRRNPTPTGLAPSQR